MCQGTSIIYTSESVLNTPGYFNGRNYPNDQDCKRVVRFEEESSVLVEFLGEFDIEDHSTCGWDFLEIRNGEDKESPVVMKVCGRTKPQSITLQSSSIWIRFYTDRYVTGIGFALKVTQVARPECKFQ